MKENEGKNKENRSWSGQGRDGVGIESGRAERKENERKKDRKEKKEYKEMRERRRIGVGRGRVGVVSGSNGAVGSGQEGVNRLKLGHRRLLVLMMTMMPRPTTAEVCMEVSHFS